MKSLYFQFFVKEYLGLQKNLMGIQLKMDPLKILNEQDFG